MMSIFDYLEFYFRPKKWERNGSIYMLLGVVRYKKWIIRLGKKMGQISSKPGNYFIGATNIVHLKVFERQTRYNEIMHLPGILCSIPGIIFASSTEIVALCWFVLVFNFHPTILQRYNRIRIYKILNKI